MGWMLPVVLRGLPGILRLGGLQLYLFQQEQGETDFMPLLLLGVLSPGLAWLVFCLSSYIWFTGMPRSTALLGRRLQPLMVWLWLVSSWRWVVDTQGRGEYGRLICP